jgi:hypothetical protein
LVYSKLPLRDPKGLLPGDFKDMEDSLCVQSEDELLGEDWLDSFVTEIPDTKYGKTDIKDVANDQKHLSKEQHKELFTVLNEHAEIFEGTLGVYPHKQFHIDMMEDATPKHARAYMVPRVHLKTYRKELNHLV